MLIFPAHLVSNNKFQKNWGQLGWLALLQSNLLATPWLCWYHRTQFSFVTNACYQSYYVLVLAYHKFPVDITKSNEVVATSNTHVQRKTHYHVILHWYTNRCMYHQAIILWLCQANLLNQWTRNWCSASISDEICRSKCAKIT